MYDIINDRDELAISQVDFILSPQKWGNAKSKINLEWEQIEFSVENNNNVPEEPGIYFFIVQCKNQLFPPHGYIMYIGITKRTLRTRFKEYIREKKKYRKNKRPRVYTLLNKWSGNLFFHYAVVTDGRYSLEKLEELLIKAIVPPCNEDLTSELTAARKALL